MTANSNPIPNSIPGKGPIVAGSVHRSAATAPAARTFGIAIAVLLAWTTPARAEDDRATLQGSSERGRVSDFHADVEIDPIAYIASGHSLHVGLGYRHLRVDLGAYAMRLPELFHGSEDYVVSMNGYGLKVQYFPWSEQSGGFVGIDGGVTHLLAQLDGSDLARRQSLLGIGVDLGWRFALPAGFYVTPWVGVAYNFNSRDITLDGHNLPASPLVVFPTVHFGYSFR